MKIYVSGQVTNGDMKDPEAVRNNIEYFKTMTSTLRALGHIVISPIEIAYNATWNWEQCMMAALPGLFSCEAVFLLDNWHLSKGAKIEHAIAQSMELIIIYPVKHKEFLAIPIEQ